LFLNIKPDQEHQHAGSSVEFLEMIHDHRNVFKRIVTGDEILCFMYNPETKRQSVTLLSPKNPKAQKVRMQKSRVKRCGLHLFDAKGIIHHEFVPENRL
jgi:hypothetical protein